MSLYVTSLSSSPGMTISYFCHNTIGGGWTCVGHRSGEKPSAMVDVGVLFMYCTISSHVVARTHLIECGMSRMLIDHMTWAAASYLL